MKPTFDDYSHFSAISIPGGVIKDATLQLENGKFFDKTAIIILNMGTNDVLKSGKNFEKKICQRFGRTNKILPQIIWQS